MMTDIIVEGLVVDNGGSYRMRIQKWFMDLYGLERGDRVRLNLLKNTKRKTLLATMECKIIRIGNGHSITIPIQLVKDHKIKATDVLRYEMTRGGKR